MPHDAVRSVVRRARTHQLLVVFFGMATSFVLPVVGTLGAMPAWFLPGFLFGWLATPILFLGFARAVEEAVERCGGARGASPARVLSLLLFIPGASLIVEPLLIRALAERAESLVGDEGLARKATLLAVARSAWTLGGGWLVGMIASLVFGASPIVFLAAGPLGALVLLGLATQVVVQPLLERVDLVARGGLGAVSAGTSSAFSSTPRR